MIILLSPAKTLDFADVTPHLESTKPKFHRQANELAELMRTYSPKQIAKLMNVSESLADSVCEQFATWKKKFNPVSAKQALLTYRGDVYLGLEAETLSQRECERAQSHLRILSGLYGMLRPGDLIQPYRLEMGLRVANPHGKTLVDFWGDQITRALKALLKETESQLIVNLSSAEYSAAIDFSALRAKVFTPNFKEEKDGKTRFLSFYGKKARGYMARFLIRNRAESLDELQRFDSHNYRLNSSLSKDGFPVFTRQQPPPIAETRKA